MSITLVSVIIISRSKDDLSGLLQDIAVQKISFKTEVIRITDVAPPGRARNEGAKKAQGEILAFLDSDIRLDQDAFLANLVNVLGQNTEIGACCASFRLPLHANSFQKRYAAEIAHAEIPLEEKITDVYVVPSACFVVPRELFFKVGGFHELMIRGEDSEFTERLRNAGHRTVLAPHTWCYHPAPANFQQLARTNLRNGSGAAFVDVFFPRLNLDIHPGGIIRFSPPKTWKQRQSRFLSMIIQSLRERKWLLFLVKVFYACGYFFGRAKYTFKKWFRLGPGERQSDKILIRDKIKKILVVQLGGIGDFFLSVPALKALREHYPQAQLSILIVLRNNRSMHFFPFFDRVYSLDIRYGGKLPFYHVWFDLAQLWRLRRQKFDLAINMRTLVSAKSVRKMRLLLGLIKAGMTAGRDSDGRGKFFDIKIPETMIAQKHEIEYNIDTVQALGVPVVDRDIRVEINPEIEKRISELLRSKGVASADLLIGLHIGGSPANQWPLENYNQVIQLLKKDLPAKFVVALSKGEQDLAARFNKMTGGAIIDLSGLLELEELLALIKKCGLFISNDTGPMHLAAILKTPLVALIGQGDLIRYDVRSLSDKAIVLYKQVKCSPCYKLECADLQCLKSITPKEVVQAAKKLLKDSQS